MQRGVFVKFCIASPWQHNRNTWEDFLCCENLFLKIVQYSANSEKKSFILRRYGINFFGTLVSEPWFGVDGDVCASKVKKLENLRKIEFERLYPVEKLEAFLWKTTCAASLVLWICTIGSAWFKTS